VREEEQTTLAPSSVVTAQSPQEPPTRPASASTFTAADDPDAWEGFLRAVQKEKISLFFPLKSAILLDLTQTALHIGVEKDLYFRELSRKESRTLLEDIARRFFGRTLTVEITKGGVKSGAGSTPETGPTPSPSISKAAPEQATGNDPLIQTVLDVLGGEVQGTRSHRPSGEPR
jgi:hypothetical protein